MKRMDEYFETVMEAWEMMQKTSGDEGAEWAENLNATFMNLSMIEEMGRIFSRNQRI